MTDYSMVKPTKYAGITFRSRLEARWAVFFDALGISWEYEPETFLMCGGTLQYTPDFRIKGFEVFPDLEEQMADGCWIEVKGSDEQLQESALKLGEAVEGWGPLRHRALMILGPIPDWRKGIPEHHILYWGKGPCLAWSSWNDDPSGRSAKGFLLTDATGHGSYPLPFGTSCTPKQTPYEWYDSPQTRNRDCNAAFDAARNERFGLGGMVQAATANDRPFWLGPQRSRGFSL